LGEGRHSELGVGTVSMGRGLGGDGARSVASGRLVGGVKSFEESDKSRGFGRAEVFAVGRHVATALNDLANELVLGEEKSDFIESRAAFAALVPE
jgi:methylmalonyl-CoA mutase cobalamin-binding subunit